MLIIINRNILSYSNTYSEYLFEKVFSIPFEIYLKSILPKTECINMYKYF